MRLKIDKRTLIFVFIFLIGLSILLYPLVSSTWNQLLANKVMNHYDVAIENLSPADMNEMVVRAQEYNESLLPKAVPDAFSIRENTKDEEYESHLNPTGDGLMGYIEIPVISTKSPIYHYTTEEVLQKGVGHLFGSSLPVGGNGSHCVMSAHRGLPSNKLFSDLDKVVVGDKFYLHTLGEVFAYEVDQIEVVLPDQTQGLGLYQGKDYVTLVTCTPYGVNTHRILCRGHRVPYVPGEEESTKRHAWVNMNILVSLAGALLGILIALVLVIRLRRRDASQDEKDETKAEDNRKVIHLK